MSKFMMVYKGEATDPAQMSEEDASAVMSKWASWIGKVGPDLVDVGTPFGRGVSVVDDGTTAEPIALSGFSIVEARDLEEARKLAAGHPYLSEERGNFAIEIFEMLPVPFEA